LPDSFVAHRPYQELKVNAMPLNIGWNEIVVRLSLTVIAGLLIGYNRTEHGKAAGLRTTLLVILAASVAMIEVNLLLPTAGRPSDSFVMNDLMRFPLGILTGVGFIGGGAILRRDDIVVGVTTAATLWCATVIGLCLGGGQIGLGIVATAIGLAALWVLQWIEERLRRERRAELAIELNGGELDENAIRSKLESAGYRISGVQLSISESGERRRFVFGLLGLSLPDQSECPSICWELANKKGVLRLDWKRQ
jgi:putative Mg2+ transporter-C (MgtC) family protein